MSDEGGRAVVAATPEPTRLIRDAVAALAALLGIAYIMVALQVVHVSDAAGKTSPFVPMAAAGIAFFIGAALMLSDRRIVYVLGAAVQVVVLIGYFAVAPSRDPHYETIGLLMKVVQVVMLGLLAYLTLRAPREARD
jgi:F0F1-type ATP synthase assembly protein I